jgi:hypothetical protein
MSIWTPDQSLWTPEREILFRIRKYSEIVRTIRMPRVDIGGLLRIEVMHESGALEWLTPWWHNHITDAGLDMMQTTTGRLNACQVGTGNTEPTDEDTTLQAFHAGTATRVLIGQTVQASSSPFYAEHYVRYDFATGAVNGNMAEVGAGPSALSGQNVLSRELIRDASGDPTTISISTSQALRVHYKFRHYVDMDDVAGSFSLDTDGGPVSTNTTRRANGATAYSAGWGPVGISSASTFGMNTASGCQLSTLTALQSITATTSGTSSSSATPGSYSPGSFNVTRTHVWNNAAGNQTTGLLIAVAGAGSGSQPAMARFQFLISPTITKTSLQELTLEQLWSWGRYTP